MIARQPAETARALRVVGSGASNVDDATLARSAEAGDLEACGAIWDRHHTLVRRVLGRTLGPNHDVEDHVQEVFLRFYRMRSSLKKPEALRSFLFGIALRVARSELRTRRVRSWLTLTRDGVLDDHAAPAVNADTREAIARLYAILDRLDTESRLAFVLHHVEGLELTDVAGALEVSLATAKRRLSRASGRLFKMAERDPLLSEYVQRGTAKEGP